jgi:hypothetical protein
MVESATVATSAAMHFSFPLLKFRMNAPFQSGSQIMLFAGMLFSVTDSKNPCRRVRAGFLWAVANRARLQPAGFGQDC